MLNGNSPRISMGDKCPVYVQCIDSPVSQLKIDSRMHSMPSVRIWSDVENDYGPWEPLGLILNEWVRMKPTAKPAAESSEQ